MRQQPWDGPRPTVRFLFGFVDHQSAADDVRAPGADVKCIFKGLTVLVEYHGILKFKDGLWTECLVHGGGSEDRCLLTPEDAVLIDRLDTGRRRPSRASNHDYPCCKASRRPTMDKGTPRLVLMGVRYEMDLGCVREEEEGLDEVFAGYRSKKEKN